MVAHTMAKMRNLRSNGLVKTRCVKMWYWLVCWKTKWDEYGGIGLTFSTLFSSDKRRGLKREIEPERRSGQWPTLQWLGLHLLVHRRDLRESLLSQFTLHLLIRFSRIIFIGDFIFSSITKTLIHVQMKPSIYNVSIFPLYLLVHCLLWNITQRQRIERLTQSGYLLVARYHVTIGFSFFVQFHYSYSSSSAAIKFSALVKLSTANGNHRRAPKSLSRSRLARYSLAKKTFSKVSLPQMKSTMK